MADLAGKPADPLPPVGDRKFLEIDVDKLRQPHEGHEAARRVPGSQHADG
jgi:type VI secretion system protein ImpB